MTAQIDHPHSNLHFPHCKTLRKKVTTMPAPADARLNTDNEV